MPRRQFLALAFMLLIAFLGGLALGTSFARLSDKDLIDAAARAYVEETGGSPSACAARPGIGEIRLVITCGEGEDTFTRAYDNAGREVRLDRSGPGA